MPKRIIDRSRPTAAKSYWCDGCGRPIDRGERHVKLVHVNPSQERKLLSKRFHIVCAAREVLKP